jgi:hypothetical protein
MAKNRKRQHIWKTPSILAWDHKPYGIVGEIFDMKKLEADSKKAMSYYM